MTRQGLSQYFPCGSRQSDIGRRRLRFKPTSQLLGSSIIILAFFTGCKHSNQAPPGVKTAEESPTKDNAQSRKVFTSSAETSTPPSNSKVKPAHTEPGYISPTRAYCLDSSKQPKMNGSAPRPLPEKLKSSNSASKSSFGMVSSVEPQATQAGVTILEQGGNAADAAVATALALAVTHPSAGNLGGGGFALIGKNKEVEALDFREVSPALLDQLYFNKMIDAGGKGPHSVSVPGSVAGLIALHKKYGQLPLAAVFAPAIRLASKGFTFGARQAQVLGWAWPQLRQQDAVLALFAKNKKAATAGSRLKNPQLAKTLEAIAKSEGAWFYQGEGATLLLHELQALGSLLSRDDFEHYRAEWREALSTCYLGYEVLSAPPASAGGVAVNLMLNILNQHATHPLHLSSDAGAHYFIETARRAHAERRYSVGDPARPDWNDNAMRLRYQNADSWFLTIPITEKPSENRSIRPDIYAIANEHEQTTHLSVADHQGMMVSLTTTLSGSFGSGWLSPSLGIFLSNTMAGFSRNGANKFGPSLRITTSMAPTLMHDGHRFVGAIGSPGGDTIPNTVVQLYLRLLDDHDDIAQAVNAPRLHHGFIPDEVSYELFRQITPQLKAALEARGHTVKKRRSDIGDANILLWIDDHYEGYADPREGGLAAGPSVSIDNSVPSSPAPNSATSHRPASNSPASNRSVPNSPASNSPASNSPASNSPVP